MGGACRSTHDKTNWKNPLEEPIRRWWSLIDKFYTTDQLRVGGHAAPLMSLRMSSLLVRDRRMNLHLRRESIARSQWESSSQVKMRDRLYTCIEQPAGDVMVIKCLKTFGNAGSPLRRIFTSCINRLLCFKVKKKYIHRGNSYKECNP